ncbi:MAG: LiaF-related protein [Bacteroidales bacterium]|jgi:predicted membrane protein|nr:LiaF-related protein [Bacteroidales bacterium]
MEPEKNLFKRHHHHSIGAGICIGILLLLGGSILLFINAGILPLVLKSIIFSWQMLLLLIGILSFIHKSYFSGIALIIIGMFFTLPRLTEAFPETIPYFGADFINLYYPILLILAGVLLICYWIFRTKSPHYQKYKDRNEQFFSDTTREVHHESGYFYRDVVFSGGEHIFLDTEFLGGEVNLVFGAITLDLRRTKLPEGDTVLKLKNVFSGSVILVPETWKVDLCLKSVFGGFKDSRFIGAEIDTTRRLIVEGECVFGGGELKN